MRRYMMLRFRNTGQREMCNQSKHVSVAKVLTRIAPVVTTVRVWKPRVVEILGVGMMRLVKCGVFNRFSRAVHAHKENGNDERP